MIGVVVRSCHACNGAGSLKPDARACTPCQGSGEMVVCMECGDEMPRPEAEEHGGFCAGCRAELDAIEAMEHAS